MAHITNGSISYERRVKTGDYEHKHSTATVHFALDPGDDADAIISLAGSLAAKHVFAVLHNRSPMPVHTDGPASVDDALPVADPLPIGGAADPVNSLEEIIAEVTIEDFLPPPITSLKAAKRAAKAARLGPVPEVPKDEVNDLYADTVVPEVLDVDLIGTPSPSQMADIENFVAEAPGASDAELGQALSRVAAKLKDRPKIQALIGDFVQSGQSYTLIPAVRRGEFISRLEALV